MEKSSNAAKAPAKKGVTAKAKRAQKDAEAQSVGSAAGVANTDLLLSKNIKIRIEDAVSDISSLEKELNGRVPCIEEAVIKSDKASPPAWQKFKDGTDKKLADLKKSIERIQRDGQTASSLCAAREYDQQETIKRLQRSVDDLQIKYKALEVIPQIGPAGRKRSRSPSSDARPSKHRRLGGDYDTIFPHSDSMPSSNIPTPWASLGKLPSLWTWQGDEAVAHWNELVSPLPIALPKPIRVLNTGGDPKLFLEFRSSEDRDCFVTTWSSADKGLPLYISSAVATPCYPPPHADTDPNAIVSFKQAASAPWPMPATRNHAPQHQRDRQGSSKSRGAYQSNAGLPLQ